MRWAIQCFPRCIDEDTDRCFVILARGDPVTKAINYVIVHLGCYGTRVTALSLLCKPISDG
jgi:hypothetical protein